MIFHQPTNSLSNYNYNFYFYTDQIWDFHFHKNLELIYVINGAVNCTVNNVPYRLTASDFGLCLPYDIHRYAPEKNTLYWVLVFSEDFVRSFSKQISGKTGDGFRFRCDTEDENYIKRHLINNTAPSLFTLKSCLYALGEQYLNHVHLLERDRKELENMSVIADYISENHTKDISLKSMANQLGYDYHYMSRYFRNMFNITFTDYVNIYRLETAIDLLTNTNSSITSVALQSGFQSVRTFNNFFQKNMNMTPSQYKKGEVTYKIPFCE